MKSIFIREIKNFSLWLKLILILIIYIFIVNLIKLAFILLNTENYNENYNFLITKKILLNYSIFFILIFVIPLISFDILKFNKNLVLQSIANKKLLIILLTSLITTLKFSFYIFLYSCIFFITNLWWLNNKLDFMAIILFQTALVLILTILVHLICYLIFTYKNIIMQLFLSFILCINIAILLFAQLTLNNNEVIKLRYTNSFNQIEEKQITTEELVNFSYMTNNNLYYDIPYLEANKWNQEEIFKLYSDFLKISCDSKVNVFIKEEKLKATCEVNEEKIAKEMASKDGINLIWINSINNKESSLKFKFIFDSILEENWRDKLEIIKLSLKSNYKIRNEHLLTYDFINGIYFTNNGINFYGDSKEEYETLEDFLKMLFYYYLINYSNNPTETDPITNILYLRVFENFLNTSIFSKYEFWNIYDDFSWNKGFLEGSIFESHRKYYMYDFIEVYLTNCFFLNLFNINMRLENIKSINSNLNKMIKKDYLNFSKSMEYLYYEMFPNQYNLDLPAVLNLQNLSLKKINKINFEQDLKENIKINGFKKSSYYLAFILFIILIFLIFVFIKTFKLFNQNYEVNIFSSPRVYNYKKNRVKTKKYSKWKAKTRG